MGISRKSNIIEDSNGTKYYYCFGPQTYVPIYNNSSAFQYYPLYQQQQAAQQSITSLQQYTMSTPSLNISGISSYQLNYLSGITTGASSNIGLQSGASIAYQQQQSYLSCSGYASTSAYSVYDIFVVPGIIHNELGPAIIRDTGEDYYLHGVMLSKNQWKLKLSPMGEYI